MHLQRVELSASSAAPRRARSALLQLVVGERLFLAQLLLSELATNAVVHAGTPFSVDFTLDRTVLRVDVRDGDPGTVQPRQPEAVASGGRGLLLVQEIADNWGVDRDGIGKSVWFELGGFRLIGEQL